MKYKLLVLDVDGTLLNNQKEINPRTLAALLKVQQMGVHIVLASGRPTNGVMPIAEKLELNHYGGYILSYNGGQIINVQTGELLFEKRIDPEWIPYFEKKAKKNDFAIFTYHKDFILTDKPDNKYVIQEANLNKMQIVGASPNLPHFPSRSRHRQVATWSRRKRRRRSRSLLPAIRTVWSSARPKCFPCR